MNFLTKILAFDIPENTELQSAELSFRGLPLLWMLLLIAAVLLGMAAVVFFNLLEKGTLGWVRRILLIGLRCSLLALLFFLILRPVLLAEFVGERPRGVALLIDNSESMTQSDRRMSDADKGRVAIALGLVPLQTPIKDKMPTLSVGVPKDPRRFELVKGILANTDLKLVPSLQKFGPLRPYFFGAEVRSLQDDDNTKDDKTKKDLTQRLIESYKPIEPQTALADSIMRLLQTKENDLPSAIVVVTDGQDNTSKFSLQEAALECARHKVPLHIYGVGSTEGGQLQLKEFAAPDTMFNEDTVSTPLRWRAQGFQGLEKGKVEITLTLGPKNQQKQVAKKELTIQTGEDLRDALSFVVPKDVAKGDQDLVATIKYQSGGETFVDSVTRTVRVSDAKIKLLYIEHSPRWEFKFLQPALLRDRRIKPDFILVNAAPEVAKSGPPYLTEFPKTKDKFFEAKYNLIILGDVASSYFSKDQLEWIRDFVKSGGGLIVMAGRQNMPSSYENTPLAEVLPIEFQKAKFGLDTDTRTLEYPPTLTEAGERAEWLALGDTPAENMEIWQKKLQGFHWYYPVVKLRAGATPLVVNPRAKMPDVRNRLDELPMPIMASQYYGKGEVLWLGTDETWRWRWNYQDKYFIRLWGQMIYQFGLPSLLGEGSKRAHMDLEGSQALFGKPGTVYVRLLDKDFNPRKDEKVDADLIHLDAKANEERKSTVKLSAIKGRPGEYSVLMPYDRAGKFELQVRNPEVNSFFFRVDLPPKHELEEASLPENALRDAAQISGGHFYREEDLYQLPSNLEVRKTEFTRRQEVLLWNPLAIVLFVGLITAEWLVRKFSDLS